MNKELSLDERMELQRAKWREKSRLARLKDPAKHRKNSREYARRARAADPDYYRNKNLKWNYGIDLEQFEALLETQGHTCGICKVSLPTIERRLWHVDHDHNTGKIRGILCHGCNTALGGFKHSEEALRLAIRYLKNAK